MKEESQIKILQLKVTSLQNQLDIQKDITNTIVEATKEECWNELEKSKEELLEQLVEKGTHTLEKYQLDGSNKYGIKGNLWVWKKVK